ncbi:hypothetical protein LJC33_04190 [Eubacteriales bacterium OttesenSCG-928-N13]|nr:hypothetical protein [Eubacteriales bacterium OttesenSCG-928-N13]
MHEGHRYRMRLRLMNEGLDGFEPHEALELLLFYAIPMRNVNPLAHELIDRFGSLQGVLDAPREQLMQVSGVGANVADWLNELSSALSAYARLRMKDRPKLDRLRAAIGYAEQLLGNSEHEQLWSLSANASGYLMHSQMLAQGTQQIEELQVRQVLDGALRHHAQTLIVVQRRLPTSMQTNQQDIDFTARLSSLLGTMGVYLMDNIKICGHRHSSLRENGVLVLKPATAGLSEPINPDILQHWLDD